MEKKILDPDACKKLEPALTKPAWVYQYTNQVKKWTFSIATLGEPQSGKFSLGGFRIAPDNRVSIPDYSNDREALQLGIGMDEKIYWSKLIKVGGPLGLQNLDRLVGGKCVFHPTAEARVGCPDDKALLNFAIECFEDFERSSGVFLTTGQDLGHGVLSDGTTSSLKYINDRFKGSIISDTSKPTAEGNFYTILGALRGLGIPAKQASVAFIGCGNIGEYALNRIRELGIEVRALEAVPSKRAHLEELGIGVWSPDQKAEFIKLPFDILVLNASGGSLDAGTIANLTSNARLRFICGCENLVMPDPSGALTLQKAHKIYCPTELCGMMGYLTAVEEYMSYKQKVSFKIESMYEPARKLEEATCKAVKKVLDSEYALSFEDAMRAVYAGAGI